MKMFNADGSESEMCGNGIRCVGKFVYDHHIVEKKEFDVETKAGIKHLKVTDEGGKAKAYHGGHGNSGGDGKGAGADRGRRPVL